MATISEFLHNYAPQSGWGTFFIAAFGAFAGAFAASRAHNKRTIVAELNALSAAHELALSIANRSMTFKKQCVLSLKQNFDQIKAAYNNHQMMLKAGTQRGQFHFVADLNSLPVLVMPGAALEKTIFEKTIIRGRALAALVELVGAIDSLSSSIRVRNGMVEERRNKEWSDQERIEFVLGLRTSTGIIDNRFPSNIDAIVKQTDDCIFFAKTLVIDISEYANSFRRSEGWAYRLRVPRISETDWSKLEMADLLPKDADYEKWLRGFPRPPTRWQQFLALFCHEPIAEQAK